MSLVLDSSAMLALINDEAPADFVQNLFDDADVTIAAHAINLCEVFYDLSKDKGAEVAEQAINDLKLLGLIERSDLDGAFWRDIAFLTTTQRGQKLTLALGDACGLALARRLSADFVSGDRAELESLHRAGLASVVFITP